MSDAVPSQKPGTFKDMKRKTLSPRPLHGLLVQRRESFPPPSWRDEAHARETRFRQTSPAYAAAADAPWPHGDVQAVHVGGLKLWVALDPRLPDRVERAARQDVPYHSVLQTREVALGGIMLDIGANIGRTSLPRVLLGDVRAVYGAEPDPDNFRCLVHSAFDNALRGFVLPDHVAIGDADGTATLRRSRFVGGHRLEPNPETCGAPMIDVPLRRLDTWVETHGIDRQAVTFVKVDVQGSELKVLRGAGGLLGLRKAAWQLEVDPHLLEYAGTSVREFVEAVTPHFSHFVDLWAGAPGKRHRPIGDLGEALSYLPTDGSFGTDLLLYYAPAPV